MKKIQMIIISLLLPLALLLSCQEESSDSPGDGPETGLGKKVVDANGTLLGYCTSATQEILHVISPKGYFYKLMWNGKIGDLEALYWNSIDKSGTPYLKVSEQLHMKSALYDVFLINGKFLIRQLYPIENEEYYRPANLDSNNLIPIQRDIQVKNSYDFVNGVHGAVNLDIIAIKLETTTLAECGIPENIELPIEIKCN